MKQWGQVYRLLLLTEVVMQKSINSLNEGGV